MKGIFKNWKTTAVGLATIIIGLLTSKGHLDTQTGTAIVSGIGLILAKDNNVTGDGSSNVQ